MDATVWIALIIAVAVIIVLYMFRRDLRKFFLKAGSDGVEAGIETRESQTANSGASHSVNISGNKQIGTDQKISIQQSDVNISDNVQAGHKQKIEVKDDKK